MARILWDFSGLLPRPAVPRRGIDHEHAKFLDVIGILLNLHVEIHDS
jgi:hypothetical protein